MLRLCLCVSVSLCTVLIKDLRHGSNVALVEGEPMWRHRVVAFLAHDECLIPRIEDAAVMVGSDPCRAGPVHNECPHPRN
jgi:hypothetical protein